MSAFASDLVARLLFFQLQQVLDALKQFHIPTFYVLFVFLVSEFPLEKVPLIISVGCKNLSLDVIRNCREVSESDKCGSRSC